MPRSRFLDCKSPPNPHPKVFLISIMLLVSLLLKNSSPCLEPKPFSGPNCCTLTENQARGTRLKEGHGSGASGGRTSPRSWEDQPPPGNRAAANPRPSRHEDEDGWRGRACAAELSGGSSNGVAFHPGLCLSLLLRLQQSSLKCFHCKSHNKRDTSLRLSPAMTGVT